MFWANKFLLYWLPCELILIFNECASDWETLFFLFFSFVLLKKKALMKHSVSRFLHWENNRQITRGGGKRERGERKEEKRGDGQRNASYSWMFHEWHTEDKPGWQRPCRRCALTSPLGSLPEPVPPTLYHFQHSRRSPVCSGSPDPQTRNGCFTPLNKTKLNRGGLYLTGLITQPTKVC